MKRAGQRMLAAALLWPVLVLPLQAPARELLAVGAQFERVFEYQNKGEYAGLGVELLQLMAARTGNVVHFRMVPWARAQAMLVQGQADILIGPYKAPERIASMAFSDKPFYQDQIVFYTRQDASFGWDGDYTVLKNRRVVLLNGWAYGSDWEKVRPNLQVSVANNVENGLKMLVHNHVDVFVSNRRNTDPVIARLGYGRQVKPLPRVIEVQNGYFAFPRSPAFDKLRLQFDQELNKLIETGELKKLGKRYDVSVP